MAVSSAVSAPVGKTKEYIAHGYPFPPLAERLEQLDETPQDPALVGLASHLGFPDYATAQRSPVTLLGTPAEVREELAKRSADTGVSYYILFPATPDTQALFVDEVMPAVVG